ncbi:MAG: MBL fold metallo-hydrolase [Planctomycetota bacterium]|jgi:glyoxylase-like metal-dependent hydrolase (beta-lactamase superfamily II)
MTVELENLTIDVLSDGEFRLDGGAMFGMVPRERWREWCPPDERNRIRLQTHTLLVRGPDFVLLADPGIGDDVDRDWFAVTKEPSLEDSLGSVGLSPEDVTHVVFTHLHFDHAGGGDRFPNAEYIVQREEWDSMTLRAVRMSKSYRRGDRPPKERTRFLEGHAEPLPGVVLRPTGGHTLGHQVMVLEDAAIFWGDLMPTAHHVSPARLMAYDLTPLTVIDQKLLLLAESEEKGWLSFLYHDLDPRPGRITRDAKRRFHLERE